jgi:NADH-quinone oxidoreductase subunit A
MTIILTTTAEDIARRITEVNNYTTVPNLYHTIRSGYRVCVESDLVSRLYISLASDLGVNHGIFQVSLILSALLCGVLALVAQLFSRDMVQETEKKSPYECGFFPFDSATRLPFDVHFYVVGIMFLVFDVELIILTTIIILAATMPWSALALVAGFVIILTVGFVYEWNCGALRWESKLPEPVQSSTNHNVAFSFSLLLLFVVDIPTYVELFFSSVLPYVTSTILPFFILGAAFVSKKGRKSTAVRKQSLRYRLSRFITRQRNYLVSRFGKPPVVLRRRAVYT